MRWESPARFGPSIPRLTQSSPKVPVGMHPAHVVVSPDGRFAYITNGGDNTVSVIDTAARSLVATIPVGKFPHGLRISPDGKQAYVANLKGGTVSVIDTASQKEIAQVPAGRGRLKWASRRTGVLSWCRCRRKTRSP